MRDKLIGKGSIPALALVGVLAAVGLGYGATPTMAASVAPASETGGDYRPSEWAETSDAASSGKTPTLTDDAIESTDGTGSQLPLGVGLLGLGVLGIVYGLATEVRKPLGAPTRPA